MQISTVCIRYFQCLRQILLMQVGNLAVKKCALAIVVHNIVGNGQTLLTGGLGGENGLDLGPRNTATRHDPFNLQRFRTIDHKNATAAFPVTPRLDQQRNRQDHVRGAGGTATLIRQRPDHWMQDGLKTRPRPGVGKNQATHRRPIQRAFGADNTVAENFPQQRHRRASGSGQFVGDGIGVHKSCTCANKQVSHCRLAAADPASQPDDVITHGQSFGGFFGKASASAVSNKALRSSGPRTSSCRLPSLSGRVPTRAERTPRA